MLYHIGNLYVIFLTVDTHRYELTAVLGTP